MDLLSFFSKPLFLISAVVHTWIDLFRAVVYLHFIFLRRFAVFPAAIFSFPVRAFVALCRQRRMEMQVQKMKKVLEHALWERMELKERLSAAVRQRSTVEAMLAELESEHGEAILQVEMLVKEVEELKEEIRTLKKVQGQHKSHQVFKNFTVKGIKHQQKIRNNDPMSMLEQHRVAALLRTLCSAMLSLVVGIVISGSDGPCTHVVMALTAVVGMSLMSSIQFFSMANQDKSVSLYAVMLLSFNWFLVGTLVYPVMRRVVVAWTS